MTISVFSKFLNMIPATIYDGADVSMVILIDPPEIPPVFMKNKGILDTTEKKIKILGDDGVTVVHEFNLADTDLKPIQDQIDALSGRLDGVDDEIAQIKIDVGANGTAITTLTGRVDALESDALLKDEYGWNVEQKNIYNASRISRTDNAINSSGVSIGDADINLHGDTVGITSSNSATTYAVFSAGGLNINDFPLTRMASGGDTDSNGANIADVKRIATDGGGLKPVDDTWDMLGYPVLNIGTSTISTSAATYEQVSAVDTKAGDAATAASTAQSAAEAAQNTADDADTLSKANATRLDNLPPAPDLSKYAELLTDVAFHQLKASGLDFSDSDLTAVIHHDHNIDVAVGDSKNVAFKSNGMKLLSAVDGDGKNINHAGDIHFNANKKLFGSSAGDLQIRYAGAIYRGDGNGSNIQFDSENDIRITGDHIRWFHSDGNQYGGISKTGINLRNSTKIVGLPQGSDDSDATNIGHIKELIAAGGGGVGFENAITYNQTQSTTFYETTATQKNAWVVATNNDSASSLTFTFDYSRQGQEVVAGVENRTKRTIIAKLKVQQSDSRTVEIPQYSVLSARYVPEISRYVYNVGKWYPTEQRVVRLEDLNYSTASDPRQVTRNILNAMPNNTICIARHQSGSGDKDTANKNRFISKGDNNSCETEECIAILIKHSTDRATGMSTTQGGSGKAWSRVLDGKRHAWFTNETAKTFSLSDDIDPTQYPEDLLFLTGDKGMMKTTVNENGDNVLAEIDGYNVPKNEADIAALGIQTEKNRSVTHYFINESELSYDWPDEDRRPLVEVQVLNTTDTIVSSGLTLTDSQSGKYSGTYNTVGSIAINSAGDWSNIYTYHNAYKHESQDYYVVFNQATAHWDVITSANPHTSIGSQAAAETVQLSAASSLPASFGDYAIDNNFDDIDSLNFITAEVPIIYDDDASKVNINFNGARPSGFVVLK